MGLASFLILGLGPQLLAARVLVARQSVSCDFETAANSGDTCSSFASGWGLTLAQFESLNPGVTCPGNLVAGANYCVMGTVSTATSTPTSTSSSAAKTTTSTTKTTSTTRATTTTHATTSTTPTSSAPPSPTQSGLAANCNKFHLVASGDTCGAIESEYGISATEFNTWNPSIDSACDNLWLGYYVCVGVPGATTTHSTTATATASAAPSPTQSGLASNCDKYHLVASGDNCVAIESEYGISATQFNTWNPSIDSNCDNLWLGYYVCVGVPGVTPTTTAKTTTPTSTGPSPQMPSIVSNCDKYYQVKSGDGCYSIETSEHITSAQFMAWNPYVDANCDNLWLGYYVCVGTS